MDDKRNSQLGASLSELSATLRSWNVNRRAAAGKPKGFYDYLSEYQATADAAAAAVRARHAIQPFQTRSAVKQAFTDELQKRGRVLPLRSFDRGSLACR